MSTDAIFEAISAKIGGIDRIDALSDPAFKDAVADATLKFRIRLRDGRRGFGLVSSDGNPQLVARAVENIEIARHAVSAPVAGPILKPFATGTALGMSFAVWPEKAEFLTGNRISRFVTKKRHGRAILDWSVALCRETLTPADPETFLRDLTQTEEDALLPAALRQDAATARTRIESGAWRPSHCIHHGDFWTGNILLPGGAETDPFYVIDWAGMQKDGYPFMDLLRMLQSLGASAGLRRSCLTQLRAATGSDPVDTIGYTLSAIGFIGQNLEHFPPDRYREMAGSLYAFAKAA